MEIKVTGCSTCSQKPCCSSPTLQPVLMPWEREEDYPAATEKRGPLVLLRKREDGFCILNYSGRCSVYGHRSFECRAWPLILTIEPKPLLVLDSRLYDLNVPCLDEIEEQISTAWDALQAEVDRYAADPASLLWFKNGPWATAYQALDA